METMSERANWPLKIWDPLLWGRITAKKWLPYQLHFIVSVNLDGACCCCLVAQSCPTLCDPMDFAAHWAPLRRRWWHPTPVLLPGKISWTEEPGRLQSMRSQRIGHDRLTSLSFFILMHCRRKCQPTPVFLPGESQGQGSLVGCCLWDRTESDTTEVT